jgi:hypothetical protein
MTTLQTELEILRIDVTTLRANPRGLQWLSTDPTELGIIGELGLTLRALHRHCFPLFYSLWSLGVYVKHLVCESFLDGLLVKERMDWRSWEWPCVSSWTAHRGYKGTPRNLAEVSFKRGKMRQM